MQNHSTGFDPPRPEPGEPSTVPSLDQLFAACESIWPCTYVWGGRDQQAQGGLDCSGYVLEALHRVGIDLTQGQPYDEGKWFVNVERIAAQCVAVDRARPGDLLIISNTYDRDDGTPEPYSHIGIIIEPYPVATMYDCNLRNGAGITDYSTDYWQERIKEAVRVPQLVPDLLPGLLQSPWTIDEIAEVTRCPVNHVASYWPRVLAELQGVRQASTNSLAVALGTLAIETAHRMEPIEEYYNDPPGKFAYFESMYGAGQHPAAEQMGNTQFGDGAKYYGRGFIQITWKNNYAYYGGRFGVDLVSYPQRALEPVLASQIFAAYWEDRDLQSSADEEDWETCRRKVQGGTAGLAELVRIATELLERV